MAPKLQFEECMLLAEGELRRARIHYEIMRDLIECSRLYPEVWRNFSAFFFATLNAHWDGLYISLFKLVDDDERNVIGLDRLNEYVSKHPNQFRYLKSVCLHKYEANLNEEIHAELIKLKESVEKITRIRHQVAAHSDEKAYVSLSKFLRRFSLSREEMEKVLNAFCKIYNALSEASDTGGHEPPTGTPICQDTRKLFSQLSG